MRWRLWKDKNKIEMKMTEERGEWNRRVRGRGIGGKRRDDGDRRRERTRRLVGCVAPASRTPYDSRNSRDIDEQEDSAFQIPASFCIPMRDGIVVPVCLPGFAMGRFVSEVERLTREPSENADPHSNNSVPVAVSAL
ncbi:uncharacterized protein LOC109839418 [Asparagus officinalis]|uniref:uncharacterized protein LOC109839418 n=1 Tax=Asparagus officinalis TaxID=4686 RepID=UPI00098E854D|nr:uncharacterized protein LOC109839418 [Asparagus officinalis]